MRFRMLEALNIRTHVAGVIGVTYDRQDISAQLQVAAAAAAG
jgi:hypothetical protein